MRKTGITLRAVVYTLDGGRGGKPRPCVVLDTGGWENAHAYAHPPKPAEWVRKPYAAGADRWLVLFGSTDPDVLLAVAAGTEVPPPDAGPPLDNPVVLPADTPEGVRLGAFQAKDILRPWSDQAAHEAAEAADRARRDAEVRAECAARDKRYARLAGLVDQLGVDVGRLGSYSESALVPYDKLIVVLVRLDRAEQSCREAETELLQAGLIEAADLAYGTAGTIGTVSNGEGEA